MAVFLNFALVLFTVNAAVSLVSESLVLFLKIDAVAGIAGFLVVLSLLVALVIYGLMAVTPLVPKRIFLPLTLFGPVASLVALPVMIYGFQHHEWIAWGSSLAQFLLCMVIFYRLRGSWKFRWPLLAVGQLGAEAFRWRNLLGFVAVHLFVALPVVVAYLLTCGSLAVNHFSDGFVSVRPSGVKMQVRKYVREDGKTVELVAMSHIGEPEFYRALVASFPPTATVLMEGVSDKGKVMVEPVSYTKTAKDLGLAEQHEVFRPQGEVVFADVDIGQFSKTTLEFLKRTMVIHTKGITAETLTTLTEPSSEDLPQQLFNDLLTRRNEHLLTVFQERLASSDHLIIPWGAAHMPGISRGVLKAGFHLQETRERVAIRFGGVKGR